MIYVLEGPDGVGKTTLAKEIAEQKDAQVLHLTYNANWNMRKYHDDAIYFAEMLNNDGINVVLDRWCPSEAIYGKIFRDGPSFNVDFMIKYYYPLLDIQFIYCRNDNAVENHLKNAKRREEMFESMADVVEEFDGFVRDHKSMNWIEYDYDKVNMKKFVKELR
jgi:hypothetical protein